MRGFDEPDEARAVAAASDAELIRQAKEGSRDAYERLLARCDPLLERFLARQLGDKLRRHTSLADLHQEVLLRGGDVLRALPEGASWSDFEALILQHARWALGKAVRRGRDFVGESAIAPERGPDATPTPAPSEGQVTRHDQLDWFRAAVESLEEPLAAAVRLRTQGRTFAEIADALGIGEDAARKRLVRAARLLRERAPGGGRG